ncbi:hypothetical protein [Deinococcus cellulosilyticus]|uniref:Uncharacterized protein n=1 Tax=Deinococcus cellulosilyticus (strain DSM 18568 / NBRC 106333 / KACC 11606 / 5516J-15) TaxID=1223518 RepID=A0A511MW69_DEIC1|nr:hypothetical protein [Deinococcus cellulosilyticus]GEM44824.1 hypothetical protein DC3_04590 [Deinococcus cellulosilyticus NBRC 106333 = KACC 11606]
MGIGTLRRHRLLAAAVALAAADSGKTPLVQVPPAPTGLVPQDKKLPNNFTARGILAAAGIETYKQLVAFADDDLAQLSGLDQEKLQKVRASRDKWKEENPSEPAGEPEQEPSGLQETPEPQETEPAQTPEPETQTQQ